jgi:hypothetical protein
MTDLSQSDLANSFSPVGFEEFWDKMLVGGVLTPGRVTISGHGQEVKWDIKAGDGQDGASTTRKGLNPNAFSTTFQLALDWDHQVDEFAEWDRFLPILQSSFNSDTPNALTIYHPDLAELQITSAVVKKIGGKVHDGTGGATVKVDWLEYRPPKPKPPKSPSQAKGLKGASGVGGTISTKNDPNADLNTQIDNLVKQADNT